MFDQYVRRGKAAARDAVEWGYRKRKPINWGNLRRTRPISDWYGSERGKPVDRLYIDGFIERHRADLDGGHLMEIRNSHYIQRFGRPDTMTIVDIDTNNPHATLFADLDEVGSLPAAMFDAAIVTHTLQYLDPQPALANLWQALAPSGVLLLTVPSLGRLDPEIPDLDYLRWTPAGLRRELARANIPAVVEGYGNVLAAVCALYGLAIEDVTTEELHEVDPRFSLTVCARAVKP
jgi:SAM-dependent methyltransferase